MYKIEDIREVEINQMQEMRFKIKLSDANDHG